MSRNVCIVQGKTLKQAKYHLKTKLGVSKGFIQHSKAHPIYDTDQGSGNSSVYWVFISSTLFDCNASKAHGARFSTPDGSLQVTLHMAGFVDDSSGRTNCFEKAQQPTSPEILRPMTLDDQLWHNLLWASGEELELSKCSFHHIRFQFNYNGRPSMIKGKFSPDLFGIKLDGTEIQLKQLSVDESHKNLGCFKI